MNMVETALHYKNDLGLNVLPIKAIWSGKKYDKKPLIPWTELQSRKVTDADIKNWWSTYPDAGIAAVVGSISNGVVVIDCDSQQSVDEMEQLLSDSLVVPCAKSISGKRHYYFKSEKPIQKCVRFYGDMDLQAENSLITLPPTTGKNGDCYEWIVEPQSQSDFPAIPASLKASILNNTNLLNNTILNNTILNNTNLLYKGTTEQPQDAKTTTNHNDHNRPQMFIFGTRDNDLFHTANCLVKGGMPDNEISQVLEKLIISWGENPDPKWIEAKIKSALDRAERRQKNWMDEVKEFATTTDGYFSTTDCHKQLQATTTDHKKAINMALLRLKSAGIIEKHGEKNGTYRMIQQVEENVIDLFSAETTSIPLRLPLGISDLVKIMPKNIIVVAGESNAGKTAFLLNLAMANMHRHKVYYFSSEMGAVELKERVQNYDKMDFGEWKKCTFIERATDFDLAIRPDGINIIDFLEVHDEFYKIGGHIKKIFDKLDKGVAIIAIQKNPGRDEGLGGARSIEKARLYLSMSPGKIKIVKAKNWINSMINPNGMVMEYKLAKGIILRPQGDWKRE